MALPRKAKYSPTPTTEQAPVVGSPEIAPPPKTIKLLATGWSLLEPHENIWFTAGKPREVYRITKWMQAQVDAGLLKFV